VPGVRGVLLTVAATLALGAAPASATAAWFGYNDNSTLRGQFSPDRDSQLLSDAAAGSMRIDVDWSWVERSPGRLDLSMYDPIYATLLSRGIRPLLNVMGSPPWAWPLLSLCLPTSDCHFAPDRSKDAAWGHFVGEVARRYPLAVAIEVWNEPNLRAFFQPAPDPVRYTELLRAAHDAVKAVAPGMPVLGGALAPVLDETTDAKDYGLRPFLRRMYASGARGLMDGLSIHPYPHGRTDGGVYDAMDAALETRDDAGDRVPLWLTEFGVSSTASNTEMGQARVLGDLLPRLLRRPEVQGVYLHELAEPRALALAPADGYGILRSSGAPKLARCAIVLALRGSGSCPALLPDASARARWDAQERLQAASEAALEHRRQTGSYAGLTSEELHADDPTLSSLPADLSAPSGANADPSRIAVLPAPHTTDGVRLCNASTEGHSYCITIVHGGPWHFTTLRGSIADAVAATDAGTAQQW
jgi:hypothetical protein